MAPYIRAMLNIIDIYIGVSLHVIPVCVLISWKYVKLIGDIVVVDDDNDDDNDDDDDELFLWYVWRTKDV